MNYSLWLGLISLLLLVVNTWRSEIASRRAKEAVQAASEAVDAADLVGVIATRDRTEHAAAIEQVHQAVNGGLAAAKAEIALLKVQLAAAVQPEQRLEEIRGQAE